MVLNDYHQNEGVKLIGLGKVDQKLLFTNSNEKRNKKEGIQTPVLNEETKNELPTNKPLSIFG